MATAQERGQRTGDWREEYQRKVMTAQEAVARVRDGDRVMFTLAGPQTIGPALAARRGDLRNVQLRFTTPYQDAGWFANDFRDSFDIEFEIFIGDFGRPATDDHRATYLPNLFTTSFKAEDDGREDHKPIDVVCILVGPPNEAGYCNVGPNLWNKRMYARRARTVIAEVDRSQISTHGDCYLHVSEIDCFVEHTPPPPEQRLPALLAALPDERRAQVEAIARQVSPREMAPYFGVLRTVDLDSLRVLLGLKEPPAAIRAIGGYVGELIPHGATIQIGVGEPARFLPKLGIFDNKIDLGIHTEMMAPGMALLVEKGIVTNRRKALHRGKSVAVAWAGSDDADLRFIHDNPSFELYDPEHVLDIATLAGIENYHSVNNAISVDLMGQINSESVFGTRMYNGTGGQVELHMGAALSRGGRAITLLPSTALGGAVSRIAPMLDQGTTVTISRFFADTIVTEYGIARLLGKNHRERAHELIAVAHPDFRAELRAEADRLFG